MRSARKVGVEVNLCVAAPVYPDVLNSVAAIGLIGSASSSEARSLKNVGENFDEIVEAHQASLFRFALSHLRDRDEAQSVTQDCFLRAHRSLGSFKGQSSLRTWLMAILVNLIHDRARTARWRFWLKIQPIDNLQRSDLHASPEAQSLQREQVDAVWQTAATLPTQQRTVFLLRFVEDMDLLEIAAVTGLKEGTVKAHLFRAVHAVRGRLGGKV